MTKVTGFLCTSPVYEFGGWTFEFHRYCGPHPLKKDGQLRARIPATFWKMFDEFAELTKDEQKGYRVGGGCIPI